MKGLAQIPSACPLGRQLKYRRQEPSAARCRADLPARQQPRCNEPKDRHENRNATSVPLLRHEAETLVLGKPAHKSP
jgi:hypothetical protein